MIDDAKIRRALLSRFPQIEPHRFTIDELDFGDSYSVIYRRPEGGFHIATADARKRDEAEITEELANHMRDWFKRPVGRPRKTAA